jgi:hypothetical protein
MRQVRTPPSMGQDAILGALRTCPQLQHLVRLNDLSHRPSRPLDYFELEVVPSPCFSCTPNILQAAIEEVCHTDRSDWSEAGRHHFLLFYTLLGRAVPFNLAVTRKRRQDVLVAEVLGPSFVLLWRFAAFAAEKDQGLPKAVRVEVWQPRSREGALENRSDRAGAAPVLAIEARCLEMPTVPDHDLRCRRDILKMSAMVGVAGAMSTKYAIAQAALQRTPHQILGPFYPMKPFDQTADLTRVPGRPGRAEGQVLNVMGRVLNLKGEPARNAKVEVWQANAMGATPIQAILIPRRSIQTLRDRPF